MIKLKKDIFIKLIIAIIISCLMPTGILAIIFFKWPLTIIGIICVIIGFYGTPIIWISYANTKELKIVLNLILNENLYSCEDIANQISSKPETIKSTINKLITNGYLKGYLFKDNKLTINKSKKQTLENDKIKCENCGATMDYNNNKYVCSYCGNIKTIK